MGWWAPRFDYHKDGEYQEAQAFAQSFEPEDGVCYDWVFAYGEGVYDRLGRATDSLDEKADSIIKYLGAFSGLSSLIGAYIARSGHWALALSVLPMFALSVYAIWQAVKARSPMDVPFPPPVRDAIRYANAYAADLAKATFAAQWWAACAGMKAVVAEKARLIGRASLAFLGAVLCLLIPLAASVYYPIKPPS